MIMFFFILFIIIGYQAKENITTLIWLSSLVWDSDQFSIIMIELLRWNIHSKQYY